MYIVSKHITPHNITLPSHHIIKIHQNERRDSVHWRRALLGALRVRANQPATAQYFCCFLLHFLAFFICCFVLHFLAFCYILLLLHLWFTFIITRVRASPPTVVQYLSSSKFKWTCSFSGHRINLTFKTFQEPLFKEVTKLSANNR